MTRDRLAEIPDDDSLVDMTEHLDAESKQVSLIPALLSGLAAWQADRNQEQAKSKDEAVGRHGLGFVELEGGGVIRVTNYGRLLLTLRQAAAGELIIETIGRAI